MSDEIEYVRGVIEGSVAAPRAEGPHMGCVCKTCSLHVFLGSTAREALAVIEAAIAMEPWAECQCDQHIADDLEYPCDPCLFGEALCAWREAARAHRERGGE